MPGEFPHPVVHIELRTGNLARASAYYRALLEWRTEAVRIGGATYHAVELGERLQGGIVECDEQAPRWLPYVQVADITAATERARRLGALVEVEPREGPVGYRAEVISPAGGELGLWQPKS